MQVLSRTRVDALLVSLVEQVDQALPRHICAYYVHGSYGEGSPVPGSDLDVLVLSDGPVEESAVAAAKSAARRLGEDFQVVVDLKLLPVATMLEDPWVQVDRLSWHVSGPDVRPAFAGLPLDLRGHETVTHACAYITSVRGDSRVRMPLDQPPPPWSQRIRGSSTAGLAKNVAWLAAAWLVANVGYVPIGRADALLQLTDHDPDLGELATTVWRRCRADWRDRVPADETSRRELAALCARVIELETAVASALLSELNAVRWGVKCRTTIERHFE